MFVGNRNRQKSAHKNPKIGRARTIMAALVTVALLTVTTYCVDRAIYGAWETLRDAQKVTSDIPTEVVTPLTSAPRIGDPVTVFQRYGVLMGIGVSGDYPKENDQFLRDQMRLRFPHSEWDTAYVNEPFTTYAPGYFTLDDPSLIGHTLFALGSFPLALPAYSLVFILGNLILVLASIRRKWVFAGLVLIPVSFIAIHALSGTPIDRYGIPTYATFAGSVAIAVEWAFLHLPRRSQALDLDERGYSG
jgi:hypothetical protein